MAKRVFGKMTAAFAALALALALAGCSSDVNPDTGWAVDVNDNYTALIFTFNDSVREDQLEGNINIIGLGGEVVTGDLSGGGRLWSMPVTVDRAGLVRISIDSRGISARPAEIRMNPPTAVTPVFTWRPEIQAIQVRFPNALVSDLEQDHITISSTGSDAGLVALSDDPDQVNANTWILPVSITRPGEINISIEKLGIARDEETVYIYLMTPNISWEINESAIRIDFGPYNVAELPASQIDVQFLTANGTLGPIRPSQQGDYWLLPVIVARRTTAPIFESGGDISVTINRAGVVRPDPFDNVFGIAPIRFDVDAINSVTVDGSTNRTIAMDLTFTAPVSDLTPANITFVFPTAPGGYTGLPTAGAGSVTGSGRNWTVALDVPTGTGTTVEIGVTLDGVQVGREPLTIQRP